MQAFVDCIPCLMKQSVQTGRLCGLSDEKIKVLLDIVGQEVPSIALDESPPMMATRLQRIVALFLGVEDPMAGIKKMSNDAALKYYPQVVRMIENSESPLKTALQVAIAGNIIDYGAVHDLDVDKELSRIMEEEHMVLDRESGGLFAYDALWDDLKCSQSLLYLGDNAGEIVFDKALIATIKTMFPHLDITFATRGKAILNDALVEDAEFVGMHEVAHVVSSGVDTPGLVLERATEGFGKMFTSADLIISKGQGNLEALIDVEGPIYFLLVAKCQPIAKMLGCRERDIVLMKRS